MSEEQKPYSSEEVRATVEEQLAKATKFIGETKTPLLFVVALDYERVNTPDTPVFWASNMPPIVLMQVMQGVMPDAMTGLDKGQVAIVEAMQEKQGRTLN